MSYLELAQPVFTVVRLLLAEGQVDQVALTLLNRRERDHVFVHLTEVIPGVLVFACTQTLHGCEH